MIEYGPWSRRLLTQSLTKYKNGIFNILDIELGGACNFKCVYCDTPSRTTKCIIPLDEIESVVKHNDIDFIFVCGLGEPCFFDNYDLLLKILSICEKHQIGCSMFSNVYSFTDTLFEYVKKGILNVLFKFDSQNPDLLRELYRFSDIDHQLENIKRLISCAVVKDGITNVAASIVPSQKNKDEIFTLMEFCYKNNVFPLIGDLEDSGKACETYSTLKITPNELFDIRRQHLSVYSEDYLVPICPATLTAVHIGHDSQVIIDKSTGLSCSWFWLTEPKVEHPVTFCKASQFDDICKSILSIRTNRLDYVRKIMQSYKPLPFGGCGGDIQELLKFYLDAHEFYLQNNP